MDSRRAERDGTAGGKVSGSIGDGAMVRTVRVWVAEELCHAAEDFGVGQDCAADRQRHATTALSSDHPLHAFLRAAGVRGTVGFGCMRRRSSLQ